MELVLVRHARPHRIENAAEAADPELTDLGHRQAAAVADWLAHESFDAIYTSPMARARQTAAPVEAAVGMTAGVVDGVREYDADANHYIPIEDLKADRDRWRQFLAADRAEDRSAFAETVTTSLDDLIGRHRGDRIVVVCHGGVINMWAAKVLGLGNEMFFEPEYTSVNRFMAASSGERSIVSLNEVGHLRALDRA
jgi:probable phosphoglycerate mutase